MFGRRDPIRCHASGLHNFRTGRIVVSIGRLSDVLVGSILSSDEEAQRWLGWTEEDLDFQMPAGIEDIDLRCFIAPASYSSMTFTGLEAESGRAIGSLTLRWSGQAFEIGGSVLREARGQGFGTELMTAACFIAHRHFGIVDLYAGCEPANTASMRWLAKSGFAEVSGPARHTLPNGRVINAVWWVNSDPNAKRECAYATSEPVIFKRYRSPIWADLPRQRSIG
jgi:RimJ/RimL family protein N-acetyltransferase